MGKCVKIEMKDDGSFAVGIDPDYDQDQQEEAAQGADAGGGAPPDAGGPNPFAAAAAPAAPEPGAEAAPAGEGAGEPEEPMQPARTLDEALQLAKQLLSEPTGDDGESPFQQGFAGIRSGGQAPSGPDAGY